jgi:hypothetical protein
MLHRHTPGSIRTAAGGKLVADSETMLQRFSSQHAQRYGRAYQSFVQALLKLEEEGVDPEVMMETTLRALTARSPEKRYPVGPQSRPLPFLATALPTGALDAVRARLCHVPHQFRAISASDPNASGADGRLRCSA